MELNALRLNYNLWFVPVPWRGDYRLATGQNETITGVVPAACRRAIALVFLFRNLF